jgi:hypothetical protein
MPILYVHGVSVRDESGWQQVETLLRRYVAPEISSDPENVEIKYCFWGEHAAKLSWSGSSIPQTPATMALHRSVDRFKKGRAKLADFRTKLKNPRFLSRVKTNDADSEIEATESNVEFKPRLKRLKNLSKERLSNFCFETIQKSKKFSPQDKALLSAAADEVSHSEETRAELAKCKNVEEEMVVMESRVKRHFESLRHDLKDKLSHKNTWAQSVGSHLKEGFTRGISSPSFAATRAMMQIKAPLGQFVTRFLGDVFTYIHRRGDASNPGPIPKCLIENLVACREIQKVRGGEPIIVLSHSMGGQIMYDIVTHFLPEMPELEDVRVDFWCASASQVGFFEEMKLFISSNSEFGKETSKLVPHPSRKYLGHWWNVWDHNDFVSYSAHGVVDEVDDEAYNTGMDAVGAHVGYLVLPSFYRKFAEKIRKAKESNFHKMKSESASSV